MLRSGWPRCPSWRRSFGRRPRRQPPPPLLTAAAAAAIEGRAGGKKQVQRAGIHRKALESSATVEEIRAQAALMASQAALESTAAAGAAMGAMQSALERKQQRVTSADAGMCAHAHLTRSSGVIAVMTIRDTGIRPCCKGSLARKRENQEARPRRAVTGATVMGTSGTNTSAWSAHSLFLNLLECGAMQGDPC